MPKKAWLIASKPAAFVSTRLTKEVGVPIGPLDPTNVTISTPNASFGHRSVNRLAIWSLLVQL